MAGIDKIYGTTPQWDEFHAWCSANRPGIVRYFYPRDGYRDEIRPITNFPERVDQDLLVSCPIAWVVDRIKEQYRI